MKIAVCDENCEETEKAVDLLKNYFADMEIHVHIYRFHSSECLLREIADRLNFDIVFMCVERYGANGIDSAYSLRKLGFKGDLILVSSTSEFAVKGYELRAVGYLPKPCSVLKFRSVMDRITKSYDDDTYLIRQRNNIFRIPFRNIVYIESNNSKCNIHTTSGEIYTLYKRLNEIEQELSDMRFLRCHRSYIVNMNCIAEADNEFILKNGERILIRQKNLKEMKDRFFNFANRQVNTEASCKP